MEQVKRERVRLNLEFNPNDIIDNTIIQALKEIEKEKGKTKSKFVKGILYQYLMGASIPRVEFTPQLTTLPQIALLNNAPMVGGLVEEPEEVEEKLDIDEITDDFMLD